LQDDLDAVVDVPCIDSSGTYEDLVKIPYQIGDVGRDPAVLDNTAS
jgi:hypothetical protein